MTEATLDADAVFSDQWLTLRESADHLARDAQLTHAVDRWLSQRATPAQPLSAARTIVDLGCGSGSNVRFLAPRLHGSQHWRLVDHDASLLAHARLRCEHLKSLDGQAVHLETRTASLDTAWSRDLEGADLVTASALFDLLAPQDVEALADACARYRCAALFALSVDGHIRFHDASGAALASDDDRFAFTALAAHQRRDKGAGPAMGSEAPRLLREIFHRHGFNLREASTPWRLGQESLPLVESLMAGWRRALEEQVPAQRNRIAHWHGQRLEAMLQGQLSLTLGHRDLLAIPREPQP
ncbi:class I SAM-dependent methyltransferase [Salinicola rhizosphaerae]|uniref:Trans-aconitate methyltransferase n=1 Tax=Salinicola rhizosphaerae TaxID=1443141 RepID=A0ABQ3E630_9GAMM|nr:class I SAM-dependent methyltransferase [Salinicola rhizosphaerae]GHB23736.1 trans-aconitate methyltransferase [Salinicola rhizosphaerae]